jgi:hypothetical protein
MNSKHVEQFSRREFVQRFGTAMAGVSLSGIFPGDKIFAAPASALADYTNPLKPRKADFPTKAKACIYLYMYGGPSQMDLFDYKPELARHHGKTIDIEMRRRSIRKEKILGPVREFKRRGQFRFVVEQVHLAWPAVHVQVNAGLGLRREMRLAGLERIRVVGQRGGRGGEHLVAGENAGQRHASHRRAEPLHEPAPAELLYKFWIHRFIRINLSREK